MCCGRMCPGIPVVCWEVDDRTTWRDHEGAWHSNQTRDPCNEPELRRIQGVCVCWLRHVMRACVRACDRRIGFIRVKSRALLLCLLLLLRFVLLLPLFSSSSSPRSPHGFGVCLLLSVFAQLPEVPRLDWNKVFRPDKRGQQVTELITFVQTFLQYVPTKRLTAAQELKHPFFAPLLKVRAQAASLSAFAAGRSQYHRVQCSLTSSLWLLPAGWCQVQQRPASSKIWRVLLLERSFSLTCMF